MPVALISIRTSPALGPSRSSSMISSGFFASNATAARVFIVNSTFAFQDILASPAYKAYSLAVGHAGILCLLCGGGFVFVLGGASAADGVIGAGTQIHVHVVEIADDVAIVAKRWHHVILRAADVLPAACHHREEVSVAHGLERFL